MNKEFIKQLAGTLKVNDLEAFEKAISEDGAGFDLPKLNVYTDDDLNTLTQNHDDQGYHRGKKVGSEIRTKEIRDAMGLTELEGYKDTSNLVSAYKESIILDAKIEPTEKIKGLQTDLEKLQGTIKTNEESYARSLQEKDSAIKAIRTDSILSQMFPSVDGGLSTKHQVAIFKSEGYAIDFDENGKVFPIKSGEFIKDDIQNPRKLDDVVNEFRVTMGFENKPGRGGGDDVKTGSFKTMNDVFAHMEEKGIDPDSSEGQKLQDEFNNKNN